MLPDNLTLDRARRIADEFARTKGLALSGPMLDGDAEPERCDFPLYIFPPGYPSGWWVCLASRANLDILASSTVIGVSKWTGGARILGSAGDEG